MRQTVAILADYPVLFPLDGRRTRYRVSSGFGSRMHPLKGRRVFHKGVDLAAPYGEPVYAVGNGRVVSAGYSRSYGWFVRVCHEGGYSTLYAHMSRILVRKGETVRIGQRIGLVGSTGAATGNHLHSNCKRRDGRWTRWNGSAGGSKFLLFINHTTSHEH